MSCTCDCSPACPSLPAILPGNGPDLPPDPAVLPLLFELLSLRVIEPFWSSGGREGSGEGPEVRFRAAGVMGAQLVAQEIAARTTALRLTSRYQVVVLPVEAPSEGAFSIALAEPRGAVAEARADLSRLAPGFGDGVRRRARAQATAAPPPGGCGVMAAVWALTRREREVLDLFLRGYSVRTAGRALGVSPCTVRNHLKNIFPKFAVRSQRELREIFAAST